MMSHSIPDDLVKYRPARVADIERLNLISLASKRHWNYPEEWISNWIDDLGLDEDDLIESSVMVLLVNEMPKGFCAIKEGNDYYEVLHLWLLPELIGKGLGKALLNKSLDKVVQRDLPILVEADPNAEAFYKKQGFVTYGKKESSPAGRFLPLMKMKTYINH